MHKTPPDPSAPSTSKYSIGVVARLAQVPIETVRMWERRYEILAPGRTDGGHRLYSDDDVLLLRAAKSLVDSGLRPGDVFRLGRERLLQEAQRAQLSAPAGDGAADGAAAIDAVLDAARSLDQTRVAALLDGPLVNRAVFDVVEDLWLPVLVRVGRCGRRARSRSPSSTS